MKYHRNTRRPRIETVEILPPQQPERERHIHVTVTAHRQRHSAPPAWVVVLLAFGVFAWLSPFALIVGIVLVSVFLTEHPTIAVAIGVVIAALMIAAIRERRAGRQF
jgi:hypothetical protein